MGSIEVSELGRWFESEAAVLVLYGRQWLDQAAAEDVVQEVFVALMLQRQRPENVRAWLFRAVRNAALKQRRTRDRRQRREEGFAAATPRWFDPQPGVGIDARQAEAALRELAGDAREIVTLRIWGGLTLEEIAVVTDTSIATVFRKYRTALNRLRQRLGALCQTKNS